jgi:hypothetical protein
MPKSSPKPKAIAKLRHNLYSYRLRPFLDSSEAFMRTAKGEDLEGEDPEDEAIDNDVAINNRRRRS